MADDLQNRAAGVPEAGDSRPAGEGESGSVDLTKLDEFKRYQSTMDRKLTELEQRERAAAQAAAEAQRQADIIRRQNEALLKMIAEADPARADALTRELRIATMEAELAEARRREAERLQQEELVRQWTQWRQMQEEAAQAAGLDPRDPTFQRALDEAQAEPARAAQRVVTALAELARRSGGAPRSQGDEAARQRRSPVAPLPPEGGVSDASDMEQQRLRELYKKEVLEARRAGAPTRIPSIRQKYRSMGLKDI